MRTPYPGCMTIAAFFDLDNTVIRGSSLFHFARRMVGEGFLTRRDLARFAFREFRYVWSKTESKSTTRFVSDRGLSIVTGLDASEMESLCNRVVGEFLEEALIPETRDRIRQHQEQGHKTWLVTASPIEMALPISQYLGMNGALATIPEVREGRYSGYLHGTIMRGPAKGEAIRSLAERDSIDLDKSYAYSDSINDLPMLSIAGSAWVVNANKDLLRIAKKNSWGVITTNSPDASHSLPRVISEVMNHEAHPWSRSTIKANADFLGINRYNL